MKEYVAELERLTAVVLSSNSATPSVFPLDLVFFMAI